MALTPAGIHITSPVQDRQRTLFSLRRPRGHSGLDAEAACHPPHPVCPLIFLDSEGDKKGVKLINWGSDRLFLLTSLQPKLSHGHAFHKGTWEVVVSTAAVLSPAKTKQVYYSNGKCTRQWEQGGLRGHRTSLMVSG